MKAKLSRLSRRYQAALQTYLKKSAKGDTRPALELGRRAVALGLETLDVVRMHMSATVRLKLLHANDGVIKKAEKFFAEAITPIEMTHGAERQASEHLIKMEKALSRRTADLALSGQRLKRGVARRKGVEKALKKSTGHYAVILRESRRLQEHLRQLTRGILSAQEDKRKRISRRLHDEIAQTLLGINVSLLVLKKEALANAAGLQKEIASTQRLVGKSVNIMKRFAIENSRPHET